MNLAVISSFLFLIWAAIATGILWDKLQSPLLFFVVALLIGLGAQTVSSYLWLFWQATYNQFWKIPAEEAHAVKAQIAIFHVIATFSIAAPLFWLLSKRL